MQIDFGVIDHLDRQSLPIAETYRNRIDLVRRYDAAGFWGFHLTEHHFTPLGLAPSPLLFLAACAQATSRIRLIPLVLVLPLYNPLRLASEVAMLDHLSNGRLEIATGRGISPLELAYYGVNHLEARAIHEEAQAVLLAALTQETVSFRGDYFRYFDVPIELRPLQQPHPPLWGATSSPESAAGAAREKRSLAFLLPPSRVRTITDRYRETWAAEYGSAPLPRLGLARHLYVARTDAEARERAEFGYRGWYQKLAYLWEKHDPRGLADDGMHRFDAMVIAGSPDRVADRVAEEIEQSGCNYFIGRFAYGDLSHAESVGSLERFAEKVMPQFSPAIAVV